MKKYILSGVLLFALAFLLTTSAANAQDQGTDQPDALAAAVSNGFTYQGYLEFNGTPANSDYDFRFYLCDSNSGACVINEVIVWNDVGNVPVQEGFFTIPVPGGNPVTFNASYFNGDARYLEIGIRSWDSTDAYTILSGRQAILPTPYALNLRPGAQVQDLSTIGGLRSYYDDTEEEYTEIGHGGGNGYINTVGDGNLSFRHDTIPLMSLTPDGYLGINTEDPQMALHVAGSAFIHDPGNNGALIFDPSTAGVGVDPMFIIQSAEITSGTNADFFIGRNVFYNGYFDDYYYTDVGGAPVSMMLFNTYGDINFRYAGAGTGSISSWDDVLFMEGSSGRVGINETSPSSLLHITSTGSDDAKIYLEGDSDDSPSVNFRDNTGQRGVLGYNDANNVMRFVYGTSLANDTGITINSSGQVGIGMNPSFMLDVDGHTRTQVLHITGGDLAEPFIINGELEPGMVVVIDPDNPGQLRLSEKANDRLVAGCISGANNLEAGVIMYQEIEDQEGAFPVALSGRVYCWADASYGTIQPGDLLTTSDTPGHLMVVRDYDQAQGAIVGKAMEGLGEGQALILILVTLQ